MHTGTFCIAAVTCRARPGAPQASLSEQCPNGTYLITTPCRGRRHIRKKADRKVNAVAHQVIEESAGVLMQPVSRRRALQMSGVSALGLLIAACSSTPPGPGSTSASAPSGPPVRGGELVFATAMNISTLDPAFSQNTSERYAYYAMYNTLVGYDKDFNLVPELAERWETSPDGTTVTLHLRQGVKFHDGTPFDATAAKWNLDRILDERTNSPLRGSITPPLTGVIVLDPQTLRLDLARAWRPLLAALGERPGFMVSPTAVQKYGADYGVHPVGTGPFEFVSFQQDDHLQLKRFEGYWDADKVYLDSMSIRNVPEQQVQLTMLRTGEAHIADGLTAQLATTVQNDPAVAIDQAPTGKWWAMQMDCDKPPFNKPELRQAVAYATNSDGVKSTIFLDKARLATGPIGVGWAYSDTENTSIYNYDLEKAKQLVQQAGATGLSVDYRNDSSSDAQAIVQLLQGDYDKTGLKLNVGTVPAADYYNQVTDDKLNWSLTSWMPRADPDGLLRLILHTNGAQNSTGYSNPEVDRLLDQAAGIADPHAAAPIYQQIQQIVERDAPYVWIVWPDALIPRSSKVGGMTIYPDQIYRLRELWIGNETG
jgi:peptide/nickel transport system substrate-binding protein